MSGQDPITKEIGPGWQVELLPQGEDYWHWDLYHDNGLMASGGTHGREAAIEEAKSRQREAAAQVADRQKPRVVGL